MLPGFEVLLEKYVECGLPLVARLKVPRTSINGEARRAIAEQRVYTGVGLIRERRTHVAVHNDLFLNLRRSRIEQRPSHTGDAAPKAIPYEFNIGIVNEFNGSRQGRGN